MRPNVDGHPSSPRHVLLMDPVLGTGYSVRRAIEILMERGVPEGRIMLVTLIVAPEGVRNLCTAFPSECRGGLRICACVMGGCALFRRPMPAMSYRTLSVELDPPPPPPPYQSSRS